MPQKTITLTPANWQQRTNAGASINWAASIGNANMLAAADGDYGRALNSSGVGADSHSLDARFFQTAGSYPVFESDARNPALTLSCYLATGDSKNAAPYMYVADYRNIGAYEQFAPYANVNTSGNWFDRNSFWHDGGSKNVFDALATGNLFVSCIFASRPADTAQPSADFRFNAVQLTLAYTYGPNTTPNPFDFVNAAGVASTAVTSNAVTITGIDVPQLVSITGHASAVFSVNGDAFSATSRNIANGQTLQLRMTAPATVGAFVDCTVQVETRTDAWRVTAGNNTPTTVNKSANLTNVIPSWIIPDTSVTPGQQIYFQPNGQTIPSPFTLSWSELSDVQYSVGATPGAGGWFDAALPGSATTGQLISIRCKSPPGPARTGSITATIGGFAPQTITIATGAIGFIYQIDLSPIDSFEQTFAGGNLSWSPAPAGANQHQSVAGTLRAQGAPFNNYASQFNTGRMWRKADGTVVPWPVGSKLKGVGYGAMRSNFHSGAIVGNVALYGIGFRPDGSYVVETTGDTALTSNQTVFIKGAASPGFTPTGWTLDNAFDAIKNDTFKKGLHAGVGDSAGYSGYVETRINYLRIFFEVAKPPEGMTWEV